MERNIGTIKPATQRTILRADLLEDRLPGGGDQKISGQQKEHKKNMFLCFHEEIMAECPWSGFDKGSIGGDVLYIRKGPAGRCENI